LVAEHLSVCVRRRRVAACPEMIPRRF
jgi:hypothetical protein